MLKAKLVRVPGFLSQTNNGASLEQVRINIGASLMQPINESSL
jgi:hypothetical protein